MRLCVPHLLRPVKKTLGNWLLDMRDIHAQMEFKKRDDPSLSTQADYLNKIISTSDTFLCEIRLIFAEANKLSPDQNFDAVHNTIDAA